MPGKGLFMVCRAAAWFLICAVAALSFPATMSSLPKDEYEASVMIREGLLDSLDWARIKQFYVQPVNVPSGELQYLKELTDLRLIDLPTSPSRLQTYEPWSSSDVRRFFSDFPYLAPFESILSFETAPAAHRSRLSLSVQSDQTMQPLAMSSFAASTGPEFSASGSAFHRDSAMRWRERMVDVHLAGVARIELGNFDGETDHGLFFGYFPFAKDTQTFVSNWRYGFSRTWNGIMAVTDCWNRVQISADYHERQTENVQDVSCKADLGSASAVGVGVSRMAPSYSNAGLQSVYYLRAGLSGNVMGFDVSLHTGIDPAHALAVPFTFSAATRSHGGSVTMTVARIPGSLSMPMSSLAYLCRRDLDTVAHGGAFPDLTLAQCRTSTTMITGMETTMDLCSVVGGRSAEVEAIVHSRGHSIVDYEIEYGCRGGSGAFSTAHTVSLTLAREFPGLVTAHVSCAYFHKENGFESVFFRVPVDIAVIPAVSFAPFVTFYSNSERENSTGIGMKQSLYCFAKMWCEWSGQVARNERSSLEWDVHVRSSFVF